MVVLPLSLTDTLVLRHATPADADALAAFNVRMHAEEDPDPFRARLDGWTRDLVARPHPTVKPEDTLIVEESTSGRIVSTTCLIPQTWTYAGVPFKVGRPELVATEPEYRNRGLVRRQFDVLHQWCAERGQLVQAITGIPWYYRQFGYEMTVNLSGTRIGFGMHVPTLKEGEAEPFTLRLATPADLDFIAEVDAVGHERDTVYCLRDAAAWRYELDGRLETSMGRRILAVIERPDGERVGYIAYPPYTMHKGQAIAAYELKAGVSWLAVTPSVIRYIWATGQARAAAEGGTCEAWALNLGESHPAYRVARGRLPLTWPPYAWYLRVPDLVAFLRVITPVLEKRLAASIACDHTGEFRISLYRSGVLFKFDRGSLTVEPWQPTPQAQGDAAFPDQTFLHLLFGHRTLDEIRQLRVDSWVSDDGVRVILEALFPKQLSDVWPVS